MSPDEMTSTGSLGGGSRKEENVADNDSNDTAVQDALAQLRQAMLDRGDDPGSVDAQLHAVQPKVVTYSGNFADLNRMGQIAVQGEIETAPGEENIQTSDINAAFENPQPQQADTGDDGTAGSHNADDGEQADGGSDSGNGDSSEGDDGGAEGTDYESMTKAQIQEDLDSRGIEYSSSATKAELVELAEGQ